MDDLRFTSFSNEFASVNSTNEQSGGGSISDRRGLVGNDTSFEQAGGKKGALSLSFYQQYFDVDTDMVFKRLLNSAVPTQKNFITDYIQPIPDLWGPFWVSVTLVFSIGIFGNLAQFIENEGGQGEYGSDFRLVTSASTMIFLYVICVPLALFALSWYRRSELQYPFIDLICAYGYSLTIFIPVSILWTIDWNLFRWVLILIAVSLSGSVLAKALWPSFKNDPNKLIAFGTIFMVVFLHFLLAFSFKEYFFDAVHPVSPVKPAGGGSEVPTPAPQLPAGAGLPDNGGAKSPGEKPEPPVVNPPQKASQVAGPQEKKDAADTGKKSDETKDTGKVEEKKEEVKNKEPPKSNDDAKPKEEEKKPAEIDTNTKNIGKEVKTEQKPAEKNETAPEAPKKTA